MPEKDAGDEMDLSPWKRRGLMSGKNSLATRAVASKATCRSRHSELPHSGQQGQDRSRERADRPAEWVRWNVVAECAAQYGAVSSWDIGTSLGRRVIRILIPPEGEQPFQKTGQALKATAFLIHPEMGGILEVIAKLLGLQPKDVMVWILERETPAVMRVVGQLRSSGPVLSSEPEGTRFGRSDILQTHISRSHTPRADDQSRRVVSSCQFRPRSTRRMEARVNAMTPTAASTSPRWLQ